MNAEVQKVLISNAGIVSGKPLHETPDEDIECTMCLRCRTVGPTSRTRRID